MRSTRQSPKRHSPLRETFKPALKKKKKQRIAQTHFSNSRETNTQFTEKKMHDFCFTIPYGLILVGGGIVGYLKKGSVASLGGGVGTGLLLILAGYLSLKAFEKKKNSYFALALETGNNFFSPIMFLCFDSSVLVFRIDWICLDSDRIGGDCFCFFMFFIMVFFFLKIYIWLCCALLNLS